MKSALGETLRPFLFAYQAGVGYNQRMSTNIYTDSKAWPFQEAHRVLERVEQKGKTGTVIFETGYGPSGLPHIGTFGEVFRTTMVMQAFQKISDQPTKLICFSDDMDGLRKVPTNLPNQEMLAEYIGKPLTSVPDPFGTHASFAHHNNAKLCEFLDQFGFEYDFYSATEMYQTGQLNAGLLAVLKHHEEICNIVKPTLGEERRQSYSPFLPVDAESGHVLLAPVLETNPDAGTLVYEREDGKKIETSVTDGHCKLQWKADWAMRWYALDVDYEMAGKDLIDSFTIGNKINRAIGGTPPVQMVYEHFVDENGAKISKSKGNGMTIEEWLQYGPPESLSLFMYHRPERAKKLFLAVVPKTADEYLDHVAKYPDQAQDVQIENPAWHIHNGQVPAPVPVTYNMLLNLLSAAAQDVSSDLLWGFIQRYQPEVTPATHPLLKGMVDNAMAYYRDHVLPSKQYRTPTEQEREALQAAQAMLADLTGTETAEEIQTAFYTLGKEHYGKENLREWFKMLYETLFGTAQGPRLGSFVQIYGVDETRSLIDQALARQAA